MKLYSTSAITELTDTYINEFNGECIQLEEGSLGHGKLILSAPNRKHIVVNEVFLNEWNSGHTIRMYNKLPKKYNCFA